MIRPDIAGQRDWVFTLAEHGYAVVDDMLDPAKVLDPILDAMARHLGSWARGQVSREMLPRTFEAWPLEGRLSNSSAAESPASPRRSTSRCRKEGSGRIRPCSSRKRYSHCRARRLCSTFFSRS